MDSIQTIKLPAESAQTSSSTSLTSSVASDPTQATDQKSFSQTLLQAQPKQPANSDVSKVGPEAFNPLLANTSTLARQELPLENDLTKQSLPLVTNILATNSTVVTGAAPGVAVVNAGQVLANQMKVPLPGKAGIETKTLPLAESNLTPKVLLPLTSIDNPPGLSSKEDGNLSTADLLKQLQQPLLQKTTGQEADAGKMLDKSIQLLTGSDAARSEMSSSSRTPESSLNIGLNTDPVKAASENISRIAQAPKIQLPLSDSNWGEEFSNRVAWMTKNNIRSAQIKITPAHLGPIEVRISLQNDQAAVSFISNHALVRDAIDSSNARLRESFADGGFENVEVDVSSHDESNKERKLNLEEHANQYHGSDEESEEENIALTSNMTQDWSMDGKLGIDYFA